MPILILLLILLYFPLIPNLGLGGTEFGLTAPLILLCALIGLFAGRGAHPAPRLAAWQRALLAGLGLVFLVTTLLSQDLPVSLAFAPHLVTYLLALLAAMTLVNSPQRLVMLAKIILVIGFALSIWRVELRPIRLLFGLPSMGVNGLVFVYHPAVALSLVILFFPGSWFSRRWRIFAGLTLFSLVVHGILFETRAAWLAWSGMLVLFASRLPLRRWARFLPLVLVVVAFIGVNYLDVIQRNWLQTQVSLNAAAEGEILRAGSDDLIRLLAQEAGLAMFHEHPVVGWGPGMYIPLKPLFVMMGNLKEANLPGAFNSWIFVLAEMGILGIVASTLVVLLPLFHAWRLAGKGDSQEQVELRWLAFGFALGAFGLAIHLLFIDLMFSFYWFHVGLAWAAARLAMGEQAVARPARDAWAYGYRFRRSSPDSG